MTRCPRGCGKLWRVIRKATQRRLQPSPARPAWLQRRTSHALQVSPKASAASITPQVVLPPSVETMHWTDGGEDIAETICCIAVSHQLTHDQIATKEPVELPGAYEDYKVVFPKRTSIPFHHRGPGTIKSSLRKEVLLKQTSLMLSAEHSRSHFKTSSTLTFGTVLLNDPTLHGPPQCFSYPRNIPKNSTLLRTIEN